MSATRLFVAIGLPQVLRDSLALTQGGIENARWIEPPDYHVTLRFIGDTELTMADRVAEHLGRVRADAFTLHTDGFGSFGGDGPRSVHLKIRPDAALVRLQHQVEQACRDAGLTPEGRRFVPHVTIARLRGRDREAAARWLSSRLPPVPDRFAVASFGLYTARPGGGGPYDEALSFPLSGTIAS